MREHPQLLLKNINQPNQNTLSAYESRGGYQTAQKVLAMDPLAVIDEVKKSGLRGRGGAGFATGVKWGFVPRTTGKPTYLVCNADESEPGTFKDRLLLERDPHLLIEGMICSAWALNCNWACIYIRGEYGYPYTQTNKAVKEAYAKGYLGKNIFGTGFDFDLVVHRGAGAYICGEESALLESLEGKKGQPRLKPPFPAVSGLYSCPTVINNVETLCNIPVIMQIGAEAYAKLGVENSTGTKLVSASGHINKPGVYEVEMGYPILDFINNECGGVRGNKQIKAVVVGGSSMGVLRADELPGVGLDFESVKKAGSSIGSAGFIVMDEDTDMVEVLLNLSHFYSHESCGQCTPCREGGHWLEKIFRRIAIGDGLPGDLELVESICSQIAGHTICAFGDGMVFPYRSIIKKFPQDFRARIEAAIDRQQINRKPLNYELGGAH
jgi:NADH-quinone oxidoreductase subunit F